MNQSHSLISFSVTILFQNVKIECNFEQYKHSLTLYVKDVIMYCGCNPNFPFNNVHFLK